MLALLKTIDLALYLYWWIIIASAIFSWLYAFNVINANNQVIATIGRSLYQLTEPIFARIRRFLPDLGGVDISPIIVLLAIFFAQQLLVQMMVSSVAG